jgi:hypothetical protein
MIMLVMSMVHVLVVVLVMTCNKPQVDQFVVHHIETEKLCSNR